MPRSRATVVRLELNSTMNKKRSSLNKDSIIFSLLYIVLNSLNDLYSICSLYDVFFVVFLIYRFSLLEEQLMQELLMRLMTLTSKRILYVLVWETLHLVKLTFSFLVFFYR